MVEAFPNTRFERATNERTKAKSSGKSHFLQSGYGGAYPTATKLLKEMERAPEGPLMKFDFFFTINK
ncbi:MAG: hypothetical protein ACHQ1H_13365 [Nitrososphaerales archaeon]